MLSSLKIRRPNSARQRRYEERKEQRAIYDKESAQATISEDLADGQNTRLDALLKLLCEGSKLLLPSDLEEDETSSVDSIFTRMYERLKHRPQGDLHSRIVYRERKGDASSFDEIAAAKEFKRRHRESIREEEQAAEGQTPEISQDPKELQFKPRMAFAHADESIASATKRQKRGRARRSRANKRNAVTGCGTEDMPYGYEILYMIDCDATINDKYAPPQVYRDVPCVKEATDSRDAHLCGTKPVIDLQAFMENDKDGIAFIAVRTVHCSAASVLILRTDGPSSLRWTEAIYAKSRLIKQAMGNVATCYFQTGAEEHLFERQPEATQHIENLLQYADKRFDVEFAEADSLFASGIVDQEHLEYLFKPNELVISEKYEKPAAFVLEHWPTMNRHGWITLYCWSFQTDGRGFARKPSIFEILPIDAKTTAIQNLTIYPLKFATKEVQEMIQRRGEKHWDLRTATQVTYKGWDAAQDQYFPDARFMIDHNTYLKMHGNATAFQFDPSKGKHLFDQLPFYLQGEEKPSEISFFLMPPDIYGFYLNKKKWIRIFVDNIHPVSWNKKAFDRLVLPPRTKDLVRALVTVRTSQRGIKQGLGVAGKRIDITSGKGNGLIVLLHGGPGTGKTLTAESVAEIAEMPLYGVTCGDVGTSPEAVEVLVSVFLRILEYYDGLLILTSNRMGIFDEAFKSRIQIALHYENLTRSDRKKIWQNFLDMLEEDEEDVNFDEIRLRLNDLGGNEMNGRQIRNLLTTARQLAMFRNERLDYHHLELPLAVSSDFNEYTKRVQGHTDDQRARDTALR
ncbi:MAG: hypothetical protein Q9212_005049 [Teloschistes hypoglaucus]